MFALSSKGFKILSSKFFALSLLFLYSSKKLTKSLSSIFWRSRMLIFIRCSFSGLAKLISSLLINKVGTRDLKSDFLISFSSRLRKQCKLSFFSLDPKQWGQVFIFSIAWKSTVKSPLLYWSLMISSIPLYLMLVRFPPDWILSSSWSPSTITFKNQAGWSAHFFSGSILYFSQSLLKIPCPKLLSLHGKIASITGLWGSMTLL